MPTLSIVKKVVMAVTGLLWFGFLITHVAANLMLFAGPEVFNAYPVKLREMLGPLLYLAEAGLVLMLLLHAISAYKVTSENSTARPVGYAVKATRKQATAASRTMIFGGTLLLVFLVIHLWSFKYGPWDTHPQGLWGLVVDKFSNPLYVLFYEVAMVALGLHLSHGLSSALQTLGVNRPGWRPTLRKAGVAIGWAMTLAFMSMPIWGFLQSSAGR